MVAVLWLHVPCAQQCNKETVLQKYNDLLNILVIEPTIYSILKAMKQNI